MDRDDAQVRVLRDHTKAPRREVPIAVGVLRLEVRGRADEATAGPQHARLARERGDDFQLVLLRYANERLLYRLASSEHASRFVLKGTALFTLWTGLPHRATRDLDLLGFGDPSEQYLRQVFREILTLDVEEDGVHLTSIQWWSRRFVNSRSTAACASS
jgi:hypothetical protein